MRTSRLSTLALLGLLPISSAAAAGYTRNVAIVVYDGVEVLDFAGPAEVFAAAAGQGASRGEPAFNTYLVSKTRQAIVSQGFIDVLPDYAITDAPPPDIIVLPGGGTDRVLADPEWLAWVKTAAEGAETVLTVCTGAFIAGRLGLLDDQEATTWYAKVPALRAQTPRANVIPGRRFVDNGKVITTAGVSAGIDGALHLVARTLGRYVADRTAEYMEYAWAPPSYTAATYRLLNPRLDEPGRQLQWAAIALREGDRERAAAIYRALIAADPDDAEAWLQLGQSLHAEGRFEEAIAAFTEAAKGDRQRGAADYSLACAHARAGHRDRAIDAAARAIEAGAGTRYEYEHDEDLDAVRADPRFQELLARL